MENKNVETVKKDNAHNSLDGEKFQQNAVLSGGTTILENNRTVDNITSKQTDDNKTAHATETRKEVGI